MTQVARSLRIVSVLSIALAAGCGLVEPSPGEREPSPTPRGIPIGAPVTATIGAAGGTLAIAEGAFELVVPPGALASQVELTIQPIFETAHGGLGASYALGPEGTSFAVPATLRWRVPPAALAHVDPAGLGIAYRDAEGLWWWMDEASYDATEQTLAVETTHLSAWSMVQGLQLLPLAVTLGEGESTELTVVSCYDAATSPGDPLASLVGFTCDDRDPLAPLVATSDWSVGGVTGGNATYGTIAPLGSSAHSARYTAPATAPSPRTVQASVRVSEALGGRPAITLVSAITIGEAHDLAGTVRYSTERLAMTFVVEEDLVLTMAEDGLDETNYHATGTARITPESFSLGDETCTVDAPEQAIAEEYYLKIRKEPQLAVRLVHATQWNYTCVSPSGGSAQIPVQVWFATMTGLGCTMFDDVPISDADAPWGEYTVTCNPAGPTTATWDLHATE